MENFFRRLNELIELVYYKYCYPLISPKWRSHMNALEVIDALCDIMENLEGRFDWGRDEDGSWLDIISDATNYGIRYHTANVEQPGILFNAKPNIDINLRKNLAGVIGWLEEHHFDYKPRPYVPTGVAFKWNKRGTLNISWECHSAKKARKQVNKEISCTPQEYPFLQQALTKESEDEC